MVYDGNRITLLTILFLPLLPKQLISINRLGDRLQHWSFKMNFEANIMDIKPSIVAATAACEEIKKSQSFKKLLEFILLTGNILNSGHEKVRVDGQWSL